jgi:peptide/nickel transport system substrate-binding protein
MAISSGGLYRMDPAWQYPDTAYYAGIDGLDAYTRQDQAKAKQLLQKAGYKGEELVIIADSAFKNHLDTGVLAAQQLRAVGMQVKLNVMDWPTAMSTHNKADAWNLWPVMMGFLPADPYTEFGFFTGPSPMQLKPDAGLEEAQVKLANALSREEQIAAVKQFQMRMYEQVICIKCGDVGIVQATRANIVNYAPYRIPRMWDCWLT